ncbi:MAG: citrate synthase [Acidimicrobiia bacterium]|nr:citrate synthase [Acidimicrobiia bacterium]
MSEDSRPQVTSGLEGVLACYSSVCSIDGPGGVLTYRGYDIRDFVTDASFCDVTWLLWHGDWPDQAESGAFAAEVASHRGLSKGVAALLAAAPLDTANPMAVLRSAVSLVGAEDPTADDISSEAVAAKAARLVGRLPTMVAAMSRYLQGNEPIAADPSLDHAANFCWMLTGRQPSERESGALNALLNTYAEHELNASTFAARTTVGTLSDYYSAIVSGIGAVKGPLHGGAVDDAMAVFSEIGEPSGVVPFVESALAARRKVPGFGHRVYRTRDPRAIAMDVLAAELGADAGEPHWHAVASALEAELHERKGLNANVDYYSALVLYHLGFPLSMFTSFIVCSRVAGWTAHVLEQYANNRLIRPRALYDGSPPRPYPAG